MAANRFRSGRRGRGEQQRPPAGGRPAGPADVDEPARTLSFGPGGQYQEPYPPQPYEQPYQQPYEQPYPDGGYPPQPGHDPGHDPQQGYHPPQGGGYDGYDEGAHVATYRAGQSHAAPQPRLPWKQVLTGIFRYPSATFDRMRDHQVWASAVIVSALYGVLVVFGFGETRDQVFSATFGTLLPLLLSSAVAFVLGGLMLGAATHGLARQLGGDGSWAPTIGLAMLVGWLTDVPRLVVAVFVPAANPVVQVLGWATWLLCAVLLTKMVNRTHDLPWGKALAASSLQLLALLILVKLPTLS